MNGGLFKTIIGAIITTAILAGASGLVLTRLNAAEIAGVKKQQERSNTKIEKVIETQQDIRIDVAKTKKDVERILEAVERIEKQTAD